MNELMTKNEEKVVTVVHAFSGKELVIVNTPATIMSYFNRGYVVKRKA